MVKNELKTKINKKVEIKVYGLRNKKEKIIGTIKDVFNNIFIVECNGLTRSFSFNEVITKDVVIKYL